MCVVFGYSRREALEDGVLRDVTELAQEAGFRCPVAVTEQLHARYVNVPEACPWQDETGRLWDILNVLMFCIRSRRDSCAELNFSALVQNDATGPKLVPLKAVAGPGDAGELTLTIMMPDED